MVSIFFVKRGARTKRHNICFYSNAQDRVVGVEVGIHTLMGMCNVNALSVILCPTMIILMNCSPSFVCHQLPENFFNAQASKECPLSQIIGYQEDDILSFGLFQKCCHC